MPTQPITEAVATGSICQDARIDLPKVLTDQQTHDFVQDGFYVAKNLLSAQELETLKQDTLKLARGHYPCPSLKPVDGSLTDQQVLKRILCIHQPHYISPTIEHFAKHPKIAAILSQITAAHLPFWDGSVKCMQSMLFVKPPQFQGQAWHQDEIYIPTRDRSLIGAWIAIDDATIDNGCLWVLPGSQQTGYLYLQRAHDKPHEFDASEQSYGFDDSSEIPVEVSAGSVVFFNGYLLHRSRKNNSSIFRRALVSHYMNAWSLLPWTSSIDRNSANESIPISRCDQRCVVPVAGIDPYAWKGKVQPIQSVFLRQCQATQ